MKKLTALLVVCTMMTCAFASCGDDKATEISTEKSVSETEAETEASTAEETSGEESSEEETTMQETEEETTAEADISEESILGMWYTEEDNVLMGFSFKESGNVDVFMDITEMTHFTADGKLFMEDVSLESEFDGTTLSVNFNGQDILTMTRYSGSSDNLDGEYTLLSGVFYDNMVESSGNSSLYTVVNGETMYLGYRDILTYTTDGNNISISGLEKMDFEGGDNLNTTYEIKDNVLTIPELDNGDDMVLSKFDISAVPQKTTADTAEDTTVSIPDEERTTEGGILGSWYATDGNAYGFQFEENGTGGMFIDTTEKLHFTADGKLLFAQMTLEPKCINYDGTNLSVTFQDIDVLTMKRNDADDPDSFDGKYTIISGDFYDGLVSQLSERFGTTTEDNTVYAIVDGEKMYIEIADVFTYTADNGSISFKGLMAGMGIPDDTAFSYEFDGKNLIFTDMSNDEMIFEKFDL